MRWSRRIIDPTILLVTSREINQRLSSKAYRVATVVVMLIAAGAVVVPRLVSSGKSSLAVGVLDSGRVQLVSAIPKVSRVTGVKLKVVGEDSIATLDQAVRTGRIAFGFTGSAIVTDRPIQSGDTSALARSVFTLSGVLSTERLLNSTVVHNIPPSVVSEIMSPPTMARIALNPPKSKPKNQVAAIVGLGVLFTLLSQYGAWVLLGVIEEKSSRIVEILISVIRPRTLLIGKVLGIGLVALLQALLILAATFLAASVTGSSIVGGAGAMLLLMELGWLLLGYALDCSLFAAAGSLVSRLEDAQSVSVVVQIPMVMGYVAGLTAAGGGGGSLLHILAYVPLFAPFLVPIYWNAGVMGVVGVATAALLLAATLSLTYRLAARLYEGGILQGGQKLKFRRALALAREMD